MSLPTPSDGGAGGSTGTGTGPSTPPSSGSWKGLTAYTVNMLAAGRLDVIATFKQSFSNGNAPWAAQLIINGSIVHDVWGAATIDSITLMGSANLPAGTYVANVRWAGDSSITVYRPRMKPSWSFK